MTYTTKQNPDFPNADSCYIMHDGIEVAGPMTYQQAEDWFDRAENGE
jgi:hypothetical protein